MCSYNNNLCSYVHKKEFIITNYLPFLQEQLTPRDSLNYHSLEVRELFNL